jgi:exosortase A
MNSTLALPAPGSPWRTALPALALVWLAIGVAYHEAFAAMVQIWMRSDTFAHAFVVPPIALWLAWRRRARVMQLLPRPSPVWLLPFAAMAVLWLLGHLVAVNAALHFAATAMLVLAVPLVLGTPVARVLMFPLAYMFFAVPIGEFMLQPLMQATADFTVAALRLSGVPVYREGLQFIIPTGSWSVVEACSGVRYLMASFMVGTLFGYLNYESQKKRWIFAAVSLLMPVIANWLRAYMIVMLGHLSGNKLAAGADHLIYGWVFFGVVITLLFMVGARWADAPRPETTAAASAAPPDRAAAGWQLWATALAAGLLIALPHGAVKRLDGGDDDTPVRLALPATQASGWRDAPAVTDTWRPVFRLPSAEQRARLVHEGGAAVDLYLAYYRGQDENRKLVSSNNVLLSTSERAWNSVGGQTRAVKLGAREIQVRQTRLQATIGSREDSRPRYVVWQVYWVNGTLTPNDVAAKLLSARQRMAGMADESAAIVLYAADRPDQPGEAALQAFAAANWDSIEIALAAARDAR